MSAPRDSTNGRIVRTAVGTVDDLGFIQRLRGVGAGALWPLEFALCWMNRDYEGALDVLEREGPETFHLQQDDLRVEPIGLPIGRCPQHSRDSDAY